MGVRVSDWVSGVGQVLVLCSGLGLSWAWGLDLVYGTALRDRSWSLLWVIGWVLVSAPALGLGLCTGSGS